MEGGNLVNDRLVVHKRKIMEIHSKGDICLESEKTMKYKAVIFDLDGVICSTDRFH